MAVQAAIVAAQAKIRACIWPQVSRATSSGSYKLNWPSAREDFHDAVGLASHVGQSHRGSRTERWGSATVIGQHAIRTRARPRVDPDQRMPRDADPDGPGRRAPRARERGLDGA